MSFETTEEVWIEMTDRDCWLPSQLLVPLESRDESAGGQSSRTLRHEFDAPPAELETPLVVSLREADVLNLIDFHQDVVGLAVEIDPDRPGEVARFLELCDPEQTPLGKALRSVLEQLAAVATGDDLSGTIQRLLDDERETIPSVEPRHTQQIPGPAGSP